MDGSRFDALTRVAASAPSRRSLLGAIVGGMTAFALGGGGTDAAARKRAFGEVCSKNADCLTNDCAVKDATGRRRCACPASLVPVSDGTCGCPSDRVTLSNGTCAVACPNGGGDCSGCGNRCIVTSDGNVCSLGGASSTCNRTNVDCPVGQACSGAFCEVVC